MTDTLVNPADPPERQQQKLLEIVQALMRRVEQDTDASGAAYAQFQRAVMLEDQVRQRTAELEHALDLLNDSNARLAEASREAQAARQNLSDAIETVQEGFALFDSKDVLVMFNSRFAQPMADVHANLRPGLGFSDYVVSVSRSSELALPAGESREGWAVKRMRRHADNHVMFNVRLSGDRWLQVSEHRTGDGGTVVLQTDVTDIIRLEREERGKLLDNQARMIRATLDHLDQGVCIFDAQARLVGWNRRMGEMLKLPAGRFRFGSSFESLLARMSAQWNLPEVHTKPDLLAWAQGGEPRPPLAFELSHAPAVTLAVVAQEMPDRGFVLSFSDVSAERQAMRSVREANELLEKRVNDRTGELADALAKAERANAARARFVAAASHDLLQPLSAAKLYLAALSDEVAASGRQTVDKVANALASVEGILDALLDISKLETGSAAVDVRAVDLGAILVRLQEEFAPLAAQKGLTLTVAAANCLVRSDPGYLRRILQNLISNAIRYTNAGAVTVSTLAQPGQIEVRVEDTGPGIPPEEQRNIFREFHRLNARASASDGMGLGLAIVERACALLDHPLALSSTPGKGTRFGLTLPVLGTAEAVPVETRHRDTAPVVLPNDHIIGLVENDAELRGAVTQLLEKWGFEVIDTDSGEAALDLIGEIGIVPDVFLVDYQLGAGMNGVQFVRALRERHGPVPARIITANRSPAVRDYCAEAGLDLLYKPIRSDELAGFLLSLP